MDGDNVKNNSEAKINIFYVLILILSLVVITIGGTLTYYTLVGKEKDDSTEVRTGTLYINYVDGKTINATDLYPIDEPTIDSDSYVYRKEFSVESTGTLDQTLDIYVDVTKNEFIDGHLMYSLYDFDGNKISDGSLPTNGRHLLTSNVFLKSKESKSYVVLIWLKETFDNQNKEQACHFTGEFEIEARQIRYE